MTDKAAKPEAPRQPPRGKPFRKGKSGNPRGRPKGAKNLTGVLRRVLESRTVEDGQAVSNLELAVQRFVDQATKGDPGSVRMLLAELRRLEPEQGQPPHDCMDKIREKMEAADRQLTALLDELEQKHEAEEAEARAKGICSACGGPLPTRENADGEEG